VVCGAYCMTTLTEAPVFGVIWEVKS
jgi:hypothetical protein